MKNIKQAWSAEYVVQTLAAIGLGFTLVCVPVLTFKAMQYSSWNQPIYKSR